MKRTFAMLLITGLASNAIAGEPAAPPISIRLGARHGHVTPTRQGFAHTGGGNIDVAQPSPDSIVITMSGVAVAGGHPCKDSLACLQFDLDQSIDVVCDNTAVRRGKLSIEGRVIGLLRSHRQGGGAAEQGPACVNIHSGSVVFADYCVPAHSVGCGNNLSLNCREEPIERPILTGVRYSLRQTFTLKASHPSSLLPCKAASSEFAPDPALDPLWISYWEPFHGASKKDFGFQVTIRVVPENGTAPAAKP